MRRRIAAFTFLLVGAFTLLNVGWIASTQIQTLRVTRNEQEIAPTEPLTLQLNRPVSPSEGTLAVFIGETDFTRLFTTTGNQLSYTPSVVPLPAGETRITVWLVTPDEHWRQIAQMPLRVKSVPATVAAAPPTAKTKAATIKPSVTVGVKSQVAEAHTPVSNRPERPTYIDTTLQSSVQATLVRGPFNLQNQFDIVGTSYRNEALRFGQRGNDAPLVDLSSYLLNLKIGKTQLQTGHVSFGTNKLLIGGFGSRGLTFTAPINRVADVSIAALNGTSIVGWDNFLGLSQRKHQLMSGTLGLELLPARPGGLRVETGVLTGSLLPQAGFNQGVVNDAERSRGASVRVVATDKAGRLKLEGGFARSFFTNPNDPLLNQTENVIGVRPTTRNARYVEASYNVLQNAKLAGKAANLTAIYRHEQADPLFRSMAASVQADRLQQQFELTGSLGEITATISHLRLGDNLADVPSLLSNRTRRDVALLSVPLKSLLVPSAKPARWTSWLPTLSYNLDRTHQFGLGLPANAGFDSLSQVPNQLSVNQLVSAEWNWTKWRFSYRWNRSMQDNRQFGREFADLRNLVNTLSLGFNPSPKLQLSVDVNAEQARNSEAKRTDRTLRFGFNATWQMTQRMAFTTMFATTGAGDIAGLNRQRNAEADLQWSYRLFALESSAERQRLQSQFFIRYANRYAFTRDLLFGVNNLTKLQTLNAGMNFTW
jgi:hypothetical protein